MRQCQECDGAIRGHIGVTVLLILVFISLIYDFINQFTSLITPKMTAKFIVRWGD